MRTQKTVSGDSCPAARSAAIILLLLAYGCDLLYAQNQDDQPVVFGIVSDVQYADKNAEGPRDYRAAMQKLKDCVAELNNRQPIFTIQLGDIIDGHREDIVKSKADLDAILKVYNGLTMPRYHVVGNHCLNAGKDALRQELGLEKFYYDFTMPFAKGWRFVVLDGNDAGYGVIGDEQVKWFRETLDQAAKAGEKVICFSHYALLEDAARYNRLANPQAILDAMNATGCVVAWFAGHEHIGGYAVREGVYHVTLKGVVEAPKNAFALVELYPERIKIIGFGGEPSRDLPLTSSRIVRDVKKGAELPAPVKAEESIGKTYYFNDFEDKDAVSFWGCAPGCWSPAQAQAEKYFDLEFKGIAREKAYCGVRAFKLDLRLNDKGEGYVWNFWKGPDLQIALDKPVYVSGYIYPEQIPPDVEVALGWSVRYQDKDGRFIQANAPILNMKAVDNGWIFAQKDVTEAVRQAGWGTNTYLEFWYLDIRTHGQAFHGQRVAVYLDDLKISSAKTEQGGELLQKMKKADLPAADTDAYTVGYVSLFRDRPDHPHNLVDNSSFELGIKNWEVADASLTRTSWAIDDTQAFHGRRSLKIFRPAAAPSTAVITSQIMPIEAGQKYTLSLYARGEGAQTIEIAGAKWAVSNAWQRCVVPIEKINALWFHPGYYCVVVNHSGAGAVWLDAVQLEKGDLTGYQLPSSVELGLSANEPQHIYHPGEAVVLAVNVFNAAGREVAPAVEYKITDFEKKTVQAGKLDFILPAGAGQTEALRLPASKGYFKLTAGLKGKELAPKGAEISWGVMAPASDLPADTNLFFGVSAAADCDLLLSLFGKEAGAKYGALYNVLYWCAAPSNWQENNPQWARADRLLALMQKHNIIPLMALLGIPAWAGSDDPAKVKEEAVQGWHDYTLAVVQKYKDRVKHWEIWPEFMYAPLEPRARMYMRFLKAAHAAIRQADPEAVIVGFGEDTARLWELVGQLEAHFKLGSLDYVDAVGLDAYCYPSSPEGVDFAGLLDKLNEIIRKYNHGRPKDIWITEVGWKGLDTLYPEVAYGEGGNYYSFVSELAQAENIVRMNLIALAKGVKRFLTFPAVSRLYTDTLSIANPFPYSLLNPGDASPKIAFVAYNTMVNNLTGANFGSEIAIGENITCYQFDSPSGPLIVVWNYDNSRRPITIRVDISPALKAANMVGTPVALSTEDGRVALVLTGSPLYLKGNGIGKEALIKAFREAEIEKITLTAGWGKEGNRLVVTVNNGTPRLLDEAISLNVPAGWKTSVSNYACSLKPQENKAFDFPFEKVNFKPLSDTLTVKGASKEGLITLQLNPIPCFYTEKPIVVDGNLEEWAKRIPVDLGENNRVGVEKSVWKGKGDLSARVYTLWDENYLYAGVEVEDDIFAYPHTGKDLWANDALQIAFDPRNDAQGKDYYGQDDYEYGFSLTTNGPAVFRWLGGGGEPGAAQAVKFAVKRENGKTVYEIAWPWSALKPFNPASRRDMGFNLTVMDNDGDKAFNMGFHQHLQITEGICNGKQPGLFRDLILIKQPE